MREIRFRAWDKQNSNMIDGNNYQGSAWIADALEVLMHGGCDEWTEQLVLMQYTGLHDKNGKEIYEGDIVRLKWKDAGNHAKQTIRSVQWNGNGYGCALTEYECEVIGNVWENPELLGGVA